MIIQLRGTSGSGKSTIVKNIMGLYPPEAIKPVHREGRKQPLCYRLKHPAGKGDLAIIGHYETKCGGCDTISTPGQSYPIIFDAIRRNAQDGRHVLFEGLLISGDTKWSSQLKDLDLLVLELTTSLEECLKRVNARRAIRLGDKFTPVNPDNTVSKHKLIQKCGNSMETKFGIPVERLDCEQAFNRIRELLSV